MYREVFVPVDNSEQSDWAVARAIELCRVSDGRITGNHVYAARLHDVRFRQLETGLPAQFQSADEIKRRLGIEIGDITADGKFSWNFTECLAACGMAPAMQVGSRYYENLTPAKMGEIIEKLANE